jgi:CubicO group peptidase (beta-lactamase class C family)
MSYGVEPSDIERVAVNCFTGPIAVPPISTMFRRALGLDLLDVVQLSNDPRFLTSIFPSGTVVSTADELCRFFELLRRGGELDGVRVLDRRTVVRATGEQSYLEPDFTLFLPFRYGMGFMLGGDWISIYGHATPRAFGHVGFTNIITWADPERDVAAALMTSGKSFVHVGLPRWLDVMRVVSRECPRDGRRR